MGSARGWCCAAHSGRAPQVRAAAAYRLQWAGILNRDYPGWRDDLDRWRYLLTLSRDWPGRWTSGV
jgi:hypothetical protein